MEKKDLLKDGFTQLIDNLRRLTEGQQQIFPGKSPVPLPTAKPTRKEALVQSTRRTGKTPDDKKTMEDAGVTPEQLIQESLVEEVKVHVDDTLRGKA